MTGPRYLEKFESADAVLSYTWPNKQLQWETRQEVDAAVSRAIGANYSYSHLGYNPGIKGDAREVVRFMNVQNTPALLNTDIDTMRGYLYRIGKGKLFTIDGSSVRRWAWAIINSMPQITFSTGMNRRAPVIIDFSRLSDWMSATQETGSQALSSNITTFTITNDGSAATEEVVIRIRANSATGYHSGIVILNQTNGHSITWNRAAASADDELKLDAGASTVKYSTNNGATYTDDYANVTLGSQQNAFFLLEPGANQIKVTDGGGGTPDASFEWAFYEPFH